MYAVNISGTTPPTDGQTTGTIDRPSPVNGDEYIDRTTGDRFVYQNGQWVKMPCGCSVEGLTDTTFTNLQNSDILVYNNGIWVNRSLSTVTPLNIIGQYPPFNGQTTGVTGRTTPVNGDEYIDSVSGRRYVYQNGVWTLEPCGCAISELTDVTINAVQNNQVLVWDGALNEWTNKTIDDILGLRDFGTLFFDAASSGWYNILAANKSSIELTAVGLSDSYIRAMAFSFPNSVSIPANSRVCFVKNSGPLTPTQYSAAKGYAYPLTLANPLTDPNVMFYVDISILTLNGPRALAFKPSDTAWINGPAGITYTFGDRISACGNFGGNGAVLQLQ